MSLGNTAPSLQQSAPSAPPLSSPPASEPAPSSSPVDASPAPAADVSAPPADKPTMGHNGGPDWRAMIAGEDAKAVEQLSRYQTPADFLKAHNELRTKLSKGAEPVKLAENATPEQVAEYRKGLGLPEIAKDAKPEAFMSAYKIEIPKGYEASEAEKGLIADYAKQAYEAGYSPREVKSSVDFFFKQQQASIQADNRIAIDRQKTWQNELRDELGSKEYDAQVSAATDWLKAQFDGDQTAFDELRTARLPGGGYLGDHPWFIKLIAKQAMGDGYTDRIEANALEANGKSLEEQRSELESLRQTNPEKYNLATTQSRLDKIIDLQLKQGQIDEFGRPIRRRA